MGDSGEHCFPRLMHIYISTAFLMDSLIVCMKSLNEFAT